MMTDPILIVSITAAILAAAAFAVASVQAILTYVSWGPKHKCTFAAIGRTSKQVTTSWLGFGSRYPRVRYPLLNMDWTAVIGLVIDTEFDERIGSLLRDVVEPHTEQWYWRAVTISDIIKWWHVADDLDVLCARTNPTEGNAAEEYKISFGHLNRREKLSFLGYRWGRLWFSKERPFVRYHSSHVYRPLQRPKASWAQMLLALGIRDTKELQLRMVDADGVSDALDAPIQRIQLQSLGLLAHVLGFASVSINVTERHFLALSPRGTISIIDIPTLGKAVRFQGDILDFYGLISRSSSLWTSPASQYVLGRIHFGQYKGNGLYLSLEILAQAIRERWTTDKYNEESRKYTLQNIGSFLAGPVEKEARTMSIILKRLNKVMHPMNVQPGDTESLDPKKDITLPNMEQIRHALNHQSEHKREDFQGPPEVGISRWQKATRLVAPSVYISATFLTFSGIVCGFPTKALLQDITPWLRWRARLLYDRRRHIFKISSKLADAIGSQDESKSLRGFARETGDYLMSRGGGTTAGLYGWGIMDMQEIYDKCPQGVRDEINASSEEWDAQALTTSEICHLLKHFAVQQWAKHVKEIQRESLRWFGSINLIWIQIVLLDISIQFLIRGSWNFTKNSNDAEPNPEALGPQNDEAPILNHQLSAEPSPIGQNINHVSNAPISPPPPSTGAPTTAPPGTTISNEDSLKGSAENGPISKLPSKPMVEATIKIQEPSIPLRPLRPKTLTQRPSALSKSTQNPYSLQLSEPPKIISRSNTEAIQEEQIPNPRAAKPEPGDKEESVFGSWGAIEASVVSAIVDSRRLGFSTSSPVRQHSNAFVEEDSEEEDKELNAATNEPKDWSMVLVQALKAQSGLTFGTDVKALQDAKFKKLADLLELRALFVIALLILHPDSTDVYSIDGAEDIEMPIA